MSFKFPSFNLQSIQDSLPTLEQVKESVNKVNKEQIQPFTAKTTSLINQQLNQVQHLVDNNIEVSELPQDYLQLEADCDLLLHLYSDIIQFNQDTYSKVSYDYPPGNYALNKIKQANVGGVITSKFNQLKNAQSPQELEKIFLGESQKDKNLDEVSIQTISIPKTLYGQFGTICQKHSEELKNSNNPISLALLQISSTNIEIANARLVQDSTIINQFNQSLLDILNQQFLKVNDLRKKVYTIRNEFDYIRSISKNDQEENEQLIAKEDDLVSATEIAVLEMKKLLKPSKNLDLFKILVKAQQEYHQLASNKLSSLLSNLNEIKVEQEDEEEEDDY